MKRLKYRYFEMALQFGLRKNEHNITVTIVLYDILNPFFAKKIFKQTIAIF